MSFQGFLIYFDDEHGLKNSSKSLLYHVTSVDFEELFVKASLTCLLSLLKFANSH